MGKTAEKGCTYPLGCGDKALIEESVSTAIINQAFTFMFRQVWFKTERQ